MIKFRLTKLRDRGTRAQTPLVLILKEAALHRLHHLVPREDLGLGAAVVGAVLDDWAHE